MLFTLFTVLSFAAAAVFVCVGKAAAVWAVPVFLGSFLALILLYLLILFVAGLFVDTGKPLKKQNAFCRRACCDLAGLIVSLARVRTHLSGTELLPEDGRFLVVCNHRSMYDPLIVLQKLYRYNISFISKPENMRIPIAGPIAYGAGFLPIDRENDRNALKTILQAADYMKRSLCSMMIYPEGTRSKNGELLPFHPGSFKIAQRSSAPLVIAAVRGTEKVRGNFPLRRTDVYFDVLEVLDPEQVKSMSTARLAEYSRSLIEKHLSQS